MYFFLADYITAFLILFGAILYSSVGHGGASSYIAIMSLMGTPVGTIKPIGLILNIIVSSIGGFRFIKSNFFSFKVFLLFMHSTMQFLCHNFNFVFNFFVLNQCNFIFSVLKRYLLFCCYYPSCTRK